MQPKRQDRGTFELFRSHFDQLLNPMSVKASRYAHARQFKRMRRCLRKLRTYAGRLIRDIRRKASEPDAPLETLLERADHI